MAFGANGRFVEFGMPDVGEIPEVAVLSAAPEAQNRDLPAAGGGGSHRADTGRESGHLWVSAHSRPFDSGGHPDQPQDGMAYPSTEGVAFLHTEPLPAYAAARGAGERSGTESEMGFGHHGYQGLERRKGASGGYHRLRRPDGAFLAVWATDGFGGTAGDDSGSGLPALRHRDRQGPSSRVLIRQRAGICLPEATARSSEFRDDRMPDTPPKPRIQRAGRGFLWKLQAGLRLPGRVGEPGSRGPANTGRIEDYNPIAPHSALGMKAPVQFYAEWMSKISTIPAQI